jgi:hypothetical protein
VAWLVLAHSPGRSDTLPDQLNSFRSTRLRGIGPGQFIVANSKLTLLIGPGPFWERAALDLRSRTCSMMDNHDFVTHDSKDVLSSELLPDPVDQKRYLRKDERDVGWKQRVPGHNKWHQAVV